MEQVYHELASDKAALLAVCERLCPSMNGSRMIRLSQALVSGDPAESDWLAAELADVPAEWRQHWKQQLERLGEAGVEVISALDASYPTNLALVHDGPPLLFVRGALTADDRRSVAVVGTRTASSEGRDLAYSLARSLVERGITIASGLAKGIDTAAHAGALSAGGRTLAVYGTTITSVYPAENRALADRVASAGACISQFLPGRDTGRWAFPVRNITMSGLALGTIVVEASETSGARIQANAALAHGKQLFLVDELVTSQPWARELADDPHVTVSSDPDEILAAVERLVAPADLCL